MFRGFAFIYYEANVLSWVSINECFPGMNAPMRLYVLRFTKVPTFQRVLRDRRMINIRRVMIITRVQHKLEVASLIERDSQPNMAAYAHLLVPRIPVFSTYSIITGERFMTVITRCHVSWFCIHIL